MSRKRVSKGQIIMKKQEKLPLVAKVMQLNFSDKDFIKTFKTVSQRLGKDLKKVRRTFTSK